jgi:transcriptional regulator with XRE-family HTH domain
MDLGSAIRARRDRLGLTLEALAERTGVSRAMLSEIERGAKNPTIRVVVRIAEALGCSVSQLLGEQPSPAADRTTVVRREERRTLVDPRTGVERQSLSPSLLRRGAEVVWYVIPPGRCAGPFPPHPPGVEEHITVVRGELRCRLAGREIELREGDAVSFPADVEHEFRNAGAGPCQYILVHLFGDQAVGTPHP